MLNFIQRQDQALFLDSSRIRGVQNLDFQYDVNSENVVSLGSDAFNFGVNGPQLGRFNVSTILVSSDQLISYTGESSVNGYLLTSRNNRSNNYSFTSGYLTSYNSRCSVGELPEINASFNIFGNIGKLNSSEVSHFNEIQTGVDTELTKTSFSEFVLTIDDFNVNHVISYDININVDRRADYVLGSRYPRRIVTNWPVDISVSFVISASDYEAYNLRNYPSSKRKTDLFLGFKNTETQSYIISYDFDQMTLVSENYSSDIDSKSTVTLVYKLLKGKEELVRDGLVFYLNTLNRNMYSSTDVIKDSTFNKIDFNLNDNENSISQSCLGFNSTSTRGSSSKNYRMPASMTFMCWVNPKGAVGDDQYLFSFGDSSKNGICNFRDTGVPKFAIRLDHTLYDVGEILEDFVWSCVCFVFNSADGYVYYYLNGALISSTVLSPSIEDPSEYQMFLGCMSPFFNSFEDFYYGSLAKTLLYNRALSAEEVAKNYRVTSDCLNINDIF